MVVFLLWLWQQPVWGSPEAGIYQKLTPHRTAFSPKVGIFLLDPEKFWILHFGFDGELIKRIGGKGQGPGELVHPMGLEVNQEHLLVYDQGFINLYDQNGTFLQKVYPPESVAQFRRVTHGWIGLSGLRFGQQNDPLTLLCFDSTRQQEKELGSWRSERERLGEDVAFDREISHYNPAEAFTMVLVSKDGNWVYIQPGGEPDIHIFSMRDLKKVRTLTIDSAPIPFDTQWGEQALAYMKKKSLESGSTTRWVGRFPSHFPVIYGMGLSIEGRLSVSKWGKPLPDMNEPEKSPGNFPLQVFTATGEPTKETVFEKFMDRIIGYKPPWIYLIVFSEKDGYSFTRCTVEEIASWVGKFPLPLMD